MPKDNRDDKPRHEKMVSNKRHDSHSNVRGNRSSRNGVNFFTALIFLIFFCAI